MSPLVDIQAQTWLPEYTSDLIDLLNSVGLRVPELDYSDEAIWPAPFFALSAPDRRPQPKEVGAK